jgi:hypothetical protein
MSGLFQSPQSQFTTPNLPPYLQNYLTNAANWLGTQVGTTPAYTGPLAPGGVSQPTGQAITDIQAQEQFAQGLPQYALPALTSYATGAQTNPFLNTITSAIGAMTDQQLQERVQTIQQQLSAMGLGTSSPLLNAEAQLYGQVIPGEAAQIGQVESQGLQAQQQQQLGAINASLNYPSSLTSALFTMGQYPTQLQQTADQAQYQAFLDQFRNLYAPIQGGGQIGGLASLQAPQQTTFGPPPIAGLATGAANFFGAK